MISKKNLTKSDIKKLLNDKFFKKVFIITGKNSFFKSGANIFFKKLISDKQTKIFLFFILRDEFFKMFWHRL